LSKDRLPVALKMYQAAQQETQTPPNVADVNTDANEGIAKEGEVGDADFEVVEEEK